MSDSHQFPRYPSIDPFHIDSKLLLTTIPTYAFIDFDFASFAGELSAVKIAS
jgi:hypothetical protein